MGNLLLVFRLLMAGELKRILVYFFQFMSWFEVGGIRKKACSILQVELGGGWKIIYLNCVFV